MTQSEYQEFRFGEINIGFYYNSKTHRYTISLNYGEKYLQVTRGQGQTIIWFLQELSKFLSTSRMSKDSSTFKEIDKTDIEGEWESLEKDQLVEEIFLEGQ